ncbi:MAG: isoaspartyl peptidase/L-asparaginase [Myxococcota bacterium]
MSGFHLEVHLIRLPVLAVHGGAGDYLDTTTPDGRAERGEAMAKAVREGWSLVRAGDVRAGVLAAAGRLEADERFNAGRGARLQQDGRCRVSASLMDGRRTRLSAVYNVQDCLHPSRLADALQSAGDRCLDGEGARNLMRDLSEPLQDVRTAANVARWRALVAGEAADDPDAAVGDAGDEDLPPADRRHGTIGAVGADAGGALWACTSTGGRGHEHVGRVSDSPTPAGNYACPHVAVSATGVGEQILDLGVATRIATRVTDGMSLEHALRRTFVEVVSHGGRLGVVAVSAAGEVGLAYSTDACGAAWLDADGTLGLDPGSRR